MLPARPSGTSSPVLVVDDRVDPQRHGAAAARLHRLQGGQRGAEEAAGLGLPPGVDDDRLALADLGVVPAPHLGLDRLAHRGHVLEVVVVLLRLLRADLAQLPDGGGRGVEDVHPELLGDPPGPARVRVVRHALVDHGRGAEGQRPVDDVGVAGDPADVGHAPVHVVRVDVLVVLGRPGHVGHVAAGAVLAALRPAGRAAGVHEEQRRLGGHGHRRDGRSLVLAEQVVHEHVPAVDHGRLGRVLAGVTAPHEDLVDLLALLGRLVDGLVGLDLVIDELAAAVVAVHRDQHPAARVRDAGAAGVPAEAAEYLRVNDPEPRAGQHRDRQLGNHRHVQGDPVAGLQAERVPQHGSELIHLAEQLRIADVHVGVFFELRHEDHRGLIRVGGGMPVHAVIGRIQLAADEPLPERRVAGVQRGVPWRIPAQQVSVLREAVREMFLAEPVVDGGIVGIGLLDEILRRIDVFLLAPVHRDLRLRYLNLRALCHSLPPDGRSTRQSGWGCRRTQTRAQSYRRRTRANRPALRGHCV